MFGAGTDHALPLLSPYRGEPTRYEGRHFLVRSLLVPALALDLGDRFWWPGRPGSTATRDTGTGTGTAPDSLQLVGKDG
ncbi:hypothetical protein ACFY04_27075 [Streptomyces sp. NPDC001549]|uniref:hypothetical protein n=1 Tax=Streptomyces sp. NPDC001549 TaxID=3364586 RepID=UPI0036AB6F6F